MGQLLAAEKGKEMDSPKSLEGTQPFKNLILPQWDLVHTFDFQMYEKNVP